MLMMMMPEARRQGVTLWRLLVTMAHNFLHLLQLDVLQFVDVEALFLVSLREENEGDSKVLATGRIQTEAWQTVHRAVSHEGVTADWVVNSSIGVCDVLDIGGGHLVAVVTELIRFGFAVAGDERCEVEAFRARLSVVDDAHAVIVNVK